MHEVFIKLLEQLNSSVFVLLVIIVLAFYAVYKIGGWKQLFLTHNTRIEKVEKMAERISSIQRRVDQLSHYSNPNAPAKIDINKNLEET